MKQEKDIPFQSKQNFLTKKCKHHLKLLVTVSRMAIFPVNQKIKDKEKFQHSILQKILLGSMHSV